MRLFVAINLPDDVRDQIWTTCAPLREQKFPFRWIPAVSIHLTLKFLGEVSDDREREIADAVQDSVAGARAFSLPLGGFGAFPTVARPKVVWVGCEAVPPLELLQDRVERSMQALGFPLEGRPFRPHLTLGRARRNARSDGLARLERSLEALEFDSAVEVESVDLMRSELRREGARYTRRYAAELPE